MLKVFTDDNGDKFILDVAKVDALSIGPCMYPGRHGALVYGTQIAVGAMWFQVKMEITELADMLGLEYE